LLCAIIPNLNPGAAMNKNKFHVAGALLASLLSVQVCNAAPFVREASFQRIFDGTNFYAVGKHLPINLSVMSGDGRVVAFYGWNGQSTDRPHLFIHDFDSTAAPIDVTLPGRLKNIDTFAGMVSNTDGTRIFFVGFDKDTGDDLFYMLNGKTGDIDLLYDTTGTSIENPNDIGTDGAGNYFYYNGSDSGYRNEGDLWRISTSGSALPELAVQAAGVNHPTKGFGRFVGEFDVSDDGNTIAFFLDGWQTDTELSTTDTELFVKTQSGIKNLTHNFQNNKSDLRLSGDGSTIVYTGRDVNGEVSTTGSYDWMTMKTADALNAQMHLEDGYKSVGYRPGITTDGNVFFGSSTPNGVSNPAAYLIHTDSSNRLKIDTYSSTTGIDVKGTSEGIHLSGDGKRVLFRQLGNYMYTGAFDSNPWPTEVPTVTSISYPAPLAVGITNPDDFPNFTLSVGVSDPQGVAEVDKVAKQLLRYNGYPDDGGYGPVRVSSPAEQSPGTWEAAGNRGYQWPVPPVDPSYADYYDDPLEIEYARFSVKDLDGNVAYRDVILQAAEGGCSGTGLQTLEPEDLGTNKDVSCITDGSIQTVGGIVITRGMLLYLSGETVGLNAGFRVVDGELEILVK
jgi:hypothetical protein